MVYPSDSLASYIVLYTFVMNKPIITLDNKDVASLTLLGVSYRFLAADDENQC